MLADFLGLRSALSVRKKFDAMERAVEEKKQKFQFLKTGYKKKGAVKFTTRVKGIYIMITISRLKIKASVSCMLSK